MVADQLSNVGAPVTNQRLVLNLVSGLIDTYTSLATVISNVKPLPSFAKACSMLRVDEVINIKRSKQESCSGNSALVAHTADDDISHNVQQSHGNSSLNRDDNRGRRNNNRGNYHGRGPW